MTHIQNTTTAKHRVLMYLCVFGLLIFCDFAFAQRVVVADNEIGRMLTALQTTSAGMRDQFRDWTSYLFYSLVLVEFTIGAIKLSMESGGADISEFASFLVPRLIMIGLFVYLFRWGYPVAHVIVNSFVQAGEATAGIQLTPDGIFEYGVKLSQNITARGGILSFDGVVIFLMSAITVGLFSLIAANVMIAMAELYIVLTAGVLLLGFLGASATRQWAIGYFRFAVASGLKFVAMIVLVGIVINSLETTFPQDAPVSMDSVGVMIGMLVIGFMLTKSVPSAAASMVAGTSSGGMGFVTGATGQATSSGAKTAYNVIKNTGKSGISAGKSIGKIGGGIASGVISKGSKA